MNDKKSVRKQVKMALQNLLDSERGQQALVLIQNIEHLPQYQQADVLMAFYPLPDEIDIRPLLAEAYRNKTVLLPVITDGKIHLHPYRGEEQMKEGLFHILEPVTEEFTDYDRIDVILVPGVAFDGEGHRLGRGKGFYDRFLPLVPKAYKVGVGYNCQLLDAIPVEPHDVPLDRIVVPVSCKPRY